MFSEQRYSTITSIKSISTELVKNDISVFNKVSNYKLPSDKSHIIVTI